MKWNFPLIGAIQQPSEVLQTHNPIIHTTVNSAYSHYGFPDYICYVLLQRKQNKKHINLISLRKLNISLLGRQVQYKATWTFLPQLNLLSYNFEVTMQQLCTLKTHVQP